MKLIIILSFLILPMSSRAKKAESDVIDLDVKLPETYTDEWYDKIAMKSLPEETDLNNLQKQKTEKCIEFKKKLSKEHFLDELDVHKACILGCDFIIIGSVCKKYDFGVKPLTQEANENILGFNAEEVRQLVSEYVLTEKIFYADKDDVELMVFERLQAGKKLASNLVPLVISVIPLVLAQRKTHPISIGIVGFSLIAIVWLLANMTHSVLLFNVVLTVISCMEIVISDQMFQHALASGIIMVVYCFAALVSEGFLQAFFSVVIIAWFLYGLRLTFLSRRSGNITGFIIDLLLVVVMHEQVVIMRTDYFRRSLPLETLRIVLNGFLPVGKSSYFWKNTAVLSKFFTNDLIDIGLDRLYVVPAFVGGCVMQVLVLILVRGFLGMYMVSMYRYQLSYENFFSGLSIYLSDLFGGISYILRVVGGYETQSSRRTMYATANLLMLSYEFVYAREIILLRFMFYSWDVIVNDGAYGKLPKYLAYEVNLGRSHFPQRGAPEWMNFELLTSVVDNTVSLIFKGDNGNQCLGLGLIRRRGSRALQLVTVNHLLSTFKKRMSVIIDDGEENYFAIPSDASANDPVVVCEVPKFEGKPGVDIDFLSNEEVIDVESLWMIRKAEDNLMFELCQVRDFRFNKTGEISAAVSLKKGDSGGPVIAALKNGCIRYAGCVSRGSYDSTVGNILSTVARRAKKNHVRFDSDSDSKDSSPERSTFFDEEEIKERVRNGYRELNEAAESYLECINRCCVDHLCKDREGKWRIIADVPEEQLAKGKRNVKGIIVIDAGAESGDEVRWFNNIEDAVNDISKEDYGEIEKRKGRKGGRNKFKQWKKETLSELSLLRETYESLIRVSFGNDVSSLTNELVNGNPQKFDFAHSYQAKDGLIVVTEWDDSVWD